MSSPVRVAVIGAGAFGRNHLRVLAEVARADNVATTSEAEAPFPAELAAVVDPDPQTRANASARYGVPAFASTADLLAAGLALHAATVCTPTVRHAEAARELLAPGLDVLIEKPLTATLAEADALIRTAQANGRILAAGHLERFNPAVTAAATRLTLPMFFDSDRL